VGNSHQNRYAKRLEADWKHRVMKSIVYGCGVLLVVWGCLAAVVALWKANPDWVLALFVLLMLGAWFKLVDGLFTFDVHERKRKRRRHRR
jgi:hypothetical protein